MLGSRRISRAPPAQRPISMQPPACPQSSFPVPPYVLLYACWYFPLPPPAKWSILFLSQVRVQNLQGASMMLHPRCRHRSENKNRIRQFGTILSLNKTTGQTAGLQTSPCCDLGWCFFKHRFFYDLSRNLEALRIFPSFSWSGKCDSRERKRVGALKVRYPSELVSCGRPHASTAAL